jgi:hypothetical protein
MILSNYWKLKKGTDTISPYIYPSSSEANLGIVDTAGNSRDTYLSADSSSQYSYGREAREFAYNLGVILSSDTGSYTIDDYALANDITASFTISNLTATEVSNADGGITRVITIAGQNTSNNRETIRKVGITKTLHTRDDQAAYIALMAIVNLDEPIAVNAGGDFVVVTEWVEQ